MAFPLPIMLAFGIGLGGMTAAAAAAELRVAQSEPQQSEDQQAELLNRRNLAPTGQTVPHPGAPQIGDESAQERGAQKKSDQDTHSICSNCE